MLDEASVVMRQATEVWMIRNKLVANQQAYTFAYMKEDYYEVRHFYCPNCGDVWGMRVTTSVDAVTPRHHYYKRKCKEHGGNESMLNLWEWDNIDVLGPNVLAYLILSTDPEGLS